MIAIELSKQQALDADPKAVQQISFTGNLNLGENVNVNTIFFFHYWRKERNHFRLFTKICESSVILFCFYIISIYNDSV